METARDLNFGSDEMQVVITAQHDVGRRIREVAETHKPLFGGEHFLTGKEVCERLYIREFGIRKGLKKLVISSKIRIFIGENQ